MKDFQCDDDSASTGQKSAQQSQPQSACVQHSAWTTEEFNRAWKKIETTMSVVQPLLIVIAHYPDGCPVEYLREHFSLSKRRLRGHLNEVNRIHKDEEYAHKPRMVNRERDRGVYYCTDDHTASLIKSQDRSGVPLTVKLPS